MGTNFYKLRVMITLNLFLFLSGNIFAYKFSLHLNPHICLYNSFVKSKSIYPYHSFETNDKLLFYPNGIDQDIGLNLYFNIFYKDFILSFGGGFSKVGFKYKYADYVNIKETASFTSTYDLWEITGGFYYSLLNFPNVPFENKNKLSIKLYSGIDLNYLIDPQYVLYPINIYSNIFTYEKQTQKFENKFGLGIAPKLKIMFRVNQKEIVSIDFKYQIGLIKLQETNLEFSVRNSNIYQYEMSTYGSYFSISINKSFLLYKRK